MKVYGLHAWPTSQLRSAESTILRYMRIRHDLSTCLIATRCFFDTNR